MIININQLKITLTFLPVLLMKQFTKKLDNPIIRSWNPNMYLEAKYVVNQTADFEEPTEMPQITVNSPL